MACDGLSGVGLANPRWPWQGCGLLPAPPLRRPRGGRDPTRWPESDVGREPIPRLASRPIYPAASETAPVPFQPRCQTAALPGCTRMCGPSARRFKDDARRHPFHRLPVKTVEPPAAPTVEAFARIRRTILGPKVARQLRSNPDRRFHPRGPDASVWLASRTSAPRSGLGRSRGQI